VKPQTIGTQPAPQLAGRSNGVISADAEFEGRIRNAATLEVHGAVRGEVEGQTLKVHRGARVFGTVSVENADVDGTLEGSLSVKGLLSISSTGHVRGNVRYGRLSMSEGADLEAQLRNIPPEIAGDLELTVRNAAQARVTTSDLCAIDPDDPASALTFEASNVVGGAIVLATSPGESVTTFRQTDLEAGTVHFAHDGRTTGNVGFDVIVRDGSGATSGPSRRVRIGVLPTPR